ncbi:hypothetical protein [Colwellia sp. MEBiC06753]
MKKIILMSLLLAGCASQGVKQADQNVIIKEFYASVESVEQVTLSSHVKTGIAGGAAVGLIDELDGNHEDMIAGALAGAIVGGIVTAVAEGSDQAYQYQLNSVDQGKFSLIQKELIDHQSGCVKVRVASTATLLPALVSQCQLN